MNMLASMKLLVRRSSSSSSTLSPRRCLHNTTYYCLQRGVLVLYNNGNNNNSMSTTSQHRLQQQQSLPRHFSTITIKNNNNNDDDDDDKHDNDYYYNSYLSKQSLRRQPSAIRKLMPLMSKPGMVSLGGGLPNPNLFPIDSLQFTIKEEVNQNDEDDDDTTSMSTSSSSSTTTTKKTLLSLTKDELNIALQYSPTPGLPMLLEQLRSIQNKEHNIDKNNNNDDDDDDVYDISVTVGSQDGVTKCFEMLLNPKLSSLLDKSKDNNTEDDDVDDDDNNNDELFVEDPTYSGALAFLHPYNVKLIPIETDGHGLKPDILEKEIEKSNNKNKKNNQQDSKQRCNHRRVLYTIPTAQNPSGSTLSNERKQQIYDLAVKNDMIILEDDPYYFLHPNRKQNKSFLEIDAEFVATAANNNNKSSSNSSSSATNNRHRHHHRVIRFDSFSKIISSGIRVGYVTGPKPLITRLNYHIQGTNLHDSGLSQIMLYKLLQHWNVTGNIGNKSGKTDNTNDNKNDNNGFDQHLSNVTKFYNQRRDVIIDAANKYLKNNHGEELAKWNVPEAGMFLWFQLLNGITDTKTLIEDKASAKNVLFVPGQSFSPTINKKSSYVRASYSTASDDEIYLAMERLANLIKEEGGGGKGT